MAAGCRDASDVDQRQACQPSQEKERRIVDAPTGVHRSMEYPGRVRTSTLDFGAGPLSFSCNPQNLHGFFGPVDKIPLPPFLSGFRSPFLDDPRGTLALAYPQRFSSSLEPSRP